jgi:ABC-type nitrate/sulfonate/bicarbonate transport system ATPase subunit
MSDILLKAEHIYKSFPTQDGGKTAILEDFSLSLHTGEVVCVLGESGGGKTTLLKIISGLESYDAGHIHTDLHVPGKDLGYVAQNDHLLPWRTAEGNAALGLELYGLSREEARRTARPFLNIMELQNYGETYPNELSGGMCQRVALARMLTTAPRMIVLDEATNSLDVFAKRKVGRWLRAYVREKQICLVLVTHAIDEACAIADRILIMTKKPARVFREILITDEEPPLDPLSIHRDQALQNAFNIFNDAIKDEARKP